MLPFMYAVRNLFRDPSRLCQAIGGSALVVLMVMLAAALSDGMTRLLSASGSERNVILLGTGSEESILRSEIAEKSAGIAEASLAGIERIAGVHAVSPEIHQMVFIAAGGSERTRASVRGITPRAPLVHRRVVLVEGEFAGPGRVMVGRLAWKRLGLAREALRPGREIMVEDTPMTVAGVFAAPGTVMESEVWMDLNDLRSLSLRENLSCVVLRLDDGRFPDVDLFTKQRLDLELTALRESDYYARLSAFYSPVRAMTWMTALLIATGALLGGLNTLYAAFSPRIREIATLQAVGYGRGAILFSLAQESTLATLCGAVLAALMAVGLMEGIVVTFSIGSFSLTVTPGVALAGLCTGLLLGLIGVIPPALRCLLPTLPSALGAPV
jgi:putative ABC transport system permease protein